MRPNALFSAARCRQLVGALALVWALPQVVQAQFFYLTNNGTITITGYDGPAGNAAIPGTINGLTVTAIGDDAFTVCPNLTGLIIPDSVTSIGMAAFVSSGLTNIAIPSSVTNIGNYAFAATGLTNISVALQNPAYQSVDGVLFDHSLTRLIQCPGGFSSRIAGMKVSGERSWK